MFLEVILDYFQARYQLLLSMCLNQSENFFLSLHSKYTLFLRAKSEVLSPEQGCLCLHKLLFCKEILISFKVNARTSSFEYASVCVHVITQYIHPFARQNILVKYYVPGRQNK